jgi:hypothetical protein
VSDRIDAERLAGTLSTALDLRQQIAATAVSIAETEDWVADTLDRMARARPRDAGRLRARAARARLFAARERAQAAIYRSFERRPLATQGIAGQRDPRQDAPR